MMRALKIAYHAAWLIGLVWALTWMYRGNIADFRYGVQAAGHAPAGVAWLAAGALGFWFGLRALTGKIR